MDVSFIPKVFALLIPLAGVAAPVIVIYLMLWFRERARQQLHDTLKHYADRGMPVPRELLDPPRKPLAAYQQPRFWALTLIGVGVGLGLMFSMMDLQNLIGIGALLICIGVSQLIALALDARRKPEEAPRA